MGELRAGADRPVPDRGGVGAAAAAWPAAIGVGAAPATLLGLLAVAGCGGPPADEVDAAPPGPVTALFDLPGDTGGGYYRLPFPNDLRVRADGTLDLEDHARPNGFIAGYLDHFDAGFTGFGVDAGAFVRFSDDIDVAGLPATPAAFLAEDAAVYLVDVDPDSPDRGARVPLRCRFQSAAGATIGAHWLGCLPYPGFPLAERTTYALVVTDRLAAADGTAVAAAPTFAAVMVDESTTDPRLGRARAVYRPLRDWLDLPGGDERADVIDAAVFTTGDLTSWTGGVRDAVAELPTPAATGVAETDVTGSYTLFEGRVGLPAFQTGTVPYRTDGGEILFDPTGKAVVQAMESVRFAVSVPGGPVPASGWPVVIYAHGTGGDDTSFVGDGTAARMADAGLAVLGIDQPVHGDRNPGGTPDVDFFSVFNPVAWRDNIRQSSADNVSLVRLIPTLTLTGGDGRVHRFDGGRIAYLGHSQGGVTGPSFLAAEPAVGAVVLSGAAGLMAVLAPYKLDAGESLALLIGDRPFDEFVPFLSLWQGFLDPADPMAFAAALAVAPRPGVPAKDVFDGEGVVDHLVPNQAIEALAVAARLPPVEPVVAAVPGLALRGLAPLTAPVTAELPSGATGVLVQYAATAGEGHFVLFEDPIARRQHVEFLATWAATGRATLVAP